MHSTENVARMQRAPETKQLAFFFEEDEVDLQMLWPT